MTFAPLTLSLPDEAATTRFGRQLAHVLRIGDTLLLEGDVGAGKSHLARAIIHELMDVPEDVPSPTFTLVQTYDTSVGTIWHADLYRLADASEVEELGLNEAFSSAICLIEWPDRLHAAPTDALHVSLTTDGDGRRVTLHATDTSWAARLTEISADA